MSLNAEGSVNLFISLFLNGFGGAAAGEY